MGLMRTPTLLVLALLSSPGPHVHAQQKLLPWQRWLEVADPAATKQMPRLVNQKWYSSGGKEGALELSEDHGPWGEPYFQFSVKVDHLNEGKYPQGWPAFQWVVKPNMDLSG